MMIIWYKTNLGALNTMVTSELTGEVSMGVLLVFLVSWRRGRYIGSDQQGDRGGIATINQNLSISH